MIIYSFSNANLLFDMGEFIWRSYTIAEALPNTYQIELINKRKSAKMALNENSKTFVVYIATLKFIENIELAIHHSYVAELAVL